MKHNLFLLASLLGLIAGCTPQTSSPVPTPYPPEYLPTVIALTAQAVDTSMTASPTDDTLPIELPTETPEPALSPTPLVTYTPTSIPGHNPAAIQIILPGPMSKVVSPIALRMNIKIGDSQSMQVDLYGEDGRLLSRIVKRVPTSNNGVLQNVKIPFEIPAAAELGRITVSSLDKKGRIQMLNSVRVLLLSSGNNEINPSGDPSEPVGVFSPLLKDTASGGVLNIRGDVWPFNLNSVIFELISPENKPLGLRILNVNNINPQLFKTSIPYKVSEPTLARLTICQDDDRIPGLFYVYSQEILLNP